MTSGVEETTRPATIAPAIAAEGQPAALTTLGLMTVLIGVFLPMTDFFIVNVALPTIDSDLHASQAMLELVVSGYASAYALLLVLGGRLGDSLGRKRLFLIGMAAFTVTSLACGVAPGIDALVAGRALQGAASAMMLPQVLSTIQATRSGPARARALGSYGATGGIAVVAGQLLGGLLVSANIAGMTWRPIFLVNVPVGIVGLILAARLVPDTRSDDPAPVDLRGTLLLGWGTLALLIPLTEGRSLGWPLWTIVLLITAPVAAIAFVRAERAMEERGGVPLVPISLLRVPSMRRGLLLAVPFFTGFGGFMFVIALTLQDGSGITALDAGVILVPMALGFLAASLSTARLLPRFGRNVLTVGALIQAAGLLAIIAELARSWPHPGALFMAPGMLVLGIGQGLIMSPLFGAVLSEVPPRKAGVGSGVLATTQQGALALGVATLGSLYLTIAVPGSVGPDGAARVILGILVLNALVIGVMSRRLPVLR